jgi:hypothetical protein
MRLMIADCRLPIVLLSTLRAYSGLTQMSAEETQMGNWQLEIGNVFTT